MKALLFAPLALALAGCISTVTPTLDRPTQPSFSGGVQNSGILGQHPGAFQINADRLATYDSLIDTYGSNFTPPLKHNDGVTYDGATIWIDDQHDVDQKMMQHWKDSKTHQPKTLLQKAGL